MDNNNYHRVEPKLDAALQRELDEALGDLSIEDILDAEEKTEKRAGSKGEGEGVRHGTVVAIQGDDIFVDMGGRSEGLLPASQYEDEPLPAVGDTVDVTIEGYDKTNGLLVLSRQGAVLAATWETLEEGQAVEGRVTGHNKGGLELTINGIRAFMPVSQIEIFRVEELAPYVDQRLQCEVIEIDRADDNVIVSRRALLDREAAAKAEKLWETLAEGQTVPGVVRSIMPYGAFVDIGGVDGLLHIRDMAHSRVEKAEDVVSEGLNLQVIILSVDREERKIALGLKQILADPWDGVAAKWSEGEVVTGTVKNLADFGAFVELEPGVEGLIPMGELSFERRIHHASEVVNPGDVVKVRILSVELERKRIGLSLKRVGDDPWMGASVRWPQDEIVEGTVTRLADFGAFVELTPGVEGLVHISELSHNRVRSAGEVVREGQTVAVKVIDVDEDQRRIALSIKGAGAAEYAAADAEAPAPERKRNKPLKGGLE